MEMTLKKENYSEYSIIWNGVAGKEFGADCVIPDTMPDVRAVIDTEGNVLLRSRNIEDGRIVLEASVSAVVLYMPEGEEIVRSLPVTIPVEMEMDVPGISALDDNMRTVFRLRLRALDARMVNSRKIALRADVEAEADCYAKNGAGIACDLEAGQTPTHLLRGVSPIVTVCDIREKIFVITDSYSLPAGRAVERILTQHVQVFSEEAKFVSGKVVFRGRIKTRILFGDNRGEPVCCELYETEFSQIMESDGQGDVMPEVHIALTGVYLDMPDPSDPQGRIAAEIHMAAQCICRQCGEIQYISDVYSNYVQIIPEMENVEICAQVRPVTMRQTVAGKAEPGIGEGEVLSVSAVTGTVSRAENGVKTSVNVRVLFRGTDGQYTVSRCRLGAEFSLDIPGDCELSGVTVKVSDVYCSGGGGGADVRAVLQLDGFLVTRQTVVCVGQIDVDEEDLRDYDSYPSLTLVRADIDANLWGLAKKYHSTVEAIRLANEGKSEGLLLIPKTR